MGAVQDLHPRVPLFPEWLDLQPSTPIRQGDVLQRVAAGGDRWRETLVVLTADCDLAHSKHGGALTCVPLLKSSDYLLSFRAERLRSGLANRLVTKLLKIHLQAVGDGGAQISEERMRSWIAEESDPRTLSAELNLTGAPATRFESAALCAKTLLGQDPSSIEDAVSSLAAAKVELGDLNAEDRARQVVASDLAACIRDLPGDALFLNEVSATHVDGYVAYLRRVVELDETGVVLTASRLPADAQYLRVSRLRSPYIYALTQQFASVFSSIGLPDEYEKARDANAERVRSLEGAR